MLPSFLRGYVNSQKGFGYGPVEITKEEIQGVYETVQESS